MMRGSKGERIPPLFGAGAMYGIEIRFVNDEQGWIDIGGFDNIDQAKGYCIARLTDHWANDRISRIVCNGRIIASYEDPEQYS